MTAELDLGHTDPTTTERVASDLLALLERQRAEGLHDGAQAYVSLRGVPLVDTAIGESKAGRDLLVDDVMLWYSAGKPLTTVAVLQLWEQGRLGLDDLVAEYIEGWANGKERATLRHVLTHTAGFPMYGSRDFDTDLSDAEVVARIAAAPASWEPGTAAGYHPVTGWKVLGAVVEAIDGRRIDQYVHEEILEPLGCEWSSLGIPLDRQGELGDRLVPVHWKGHRLPIVDDDGALRMAEYHIETIHNEPWHIAKAEPGANMRGPARELGRFYESMLGIGPRLLDVRTIEAMCAVHRHGLRDAMFGFEAPWGLGVAVDFSGGAGRRAFGHGGMASSRGLADPDCGLVLVVVTNGLPSPLAAERRLIEITDTVYSALGDDVARFRRIPSDAARARTFSS